MKFNKKDLQKLCTNRGIRYLLETDKPDFKGVLEHLEYEEKLEEFQSKLIKFQHWIVRNDQRLLVIVEGGEFAGKGSVLRAFTEHLNPRSVKHVALPKPSDVEKKQWYFERYIDNLPKPGQLVFFDRSWYNRAIVEPVNGFCTKKDYQKFMGEVNSFEKMIKTDGIILLKCYLSISKEMQAKRIQSVKNNPLRRWEFTQVDKNAQKLWKEFKHYEKAMFDKTDTKLNPWKIFNGDKPYEARLKCISYVLNEVPFD
ncbi:MAG: polyphosphate kinase 2 [Saprospiraceae bacterium]|nr:polyphosphate kinase 2 [Bacteroidia bacterium]MBT8230121.1 polyphosphate kinase 2 [Bacteroidia bacterium]NNF22682.1 polyphosphate kinase 2 [Saprospiraceae bacterium]